MLCERVCVRAIDIHKWVMAGGVWIVVAVFKFKLDYKCALHVNIQIRMYRVGENGTQMEVLRRGRKLVQQYNCFLGKGIQQQSTQRQPIKHFMPSPTTDSPLPHFIKPYRQFIHKHKLIAKPKVRTRTGRVVEKVANCRVMKRDIMPAVSLNAPRPKQPSSEMVFEWMMEAASLLRVSKNAYYRAVVIVYRLQQMDYKLVHTRRLSQLVCAALVLGCKFQCSRKDYLQEVFVVNSRRVAKEEISRAQHQILELLGWQVPVNIFVEEELSEVIRLWNEYVVCVGREWEGRLQRKLLISPWEKERSKFYIEIVYVCDFLMIRLQNQLLRSLNFRTGILMAIYMLVSITVGDVQMSQNSVWPIFQRFLNIYKIVGEEEVGRIRIDSQRYYHELRILEVLGKIPLNLNYEKLIRKRSEQFYIHTIDSPY